MALKVWFPYLHLFLASPGTLLEMHVPGAPGDLLSQELWGWDRVLTILSGDSHVCLRQQVREWISESRSLGSESWVFLFILAVDPSELFN